MSGDKAKASARQKVGVEATERGRTREPCRVETEVIEGTIWLHYSTTGGSPFKSVTLSRPAAKQLAEALEELSGETKRSGFPLLKLGLLLFGIALGLGISYLLPSDARLSSPELVPMEAKREASPSTSKPDQQVNAEVGAVLSYLARPEFSGTTFEKEVLGDWSLERIYVDTWDAYFSHPGQVGQGELESLFRDPEKLTITTPKKFGTLVKTHASNLLIPPEKKVRIHFPSAEYNISLSELNDFLDNKTVYYRGLKRFTVAARRVKVSNHGAFVAKPGEPSLTRLATEITRGRSSREERLQAILDFVTKEVQYNEAEAIADYETLKRPNEVLFTQKSDCSGKTILFASLLEQLHEPYYLVYLPRHIAVLVKKGQFADPNGYSVIIRGETYVLAECTTPGFKIGKTHLKRPFRVSKIDIVQRPSERTVRDRFGRMIGRKG